MIRAFRETGSVSFQHVDVETARANYRTSCTVNGLPVERVEVVRPLALGSAGQIGGRLYDPRPIPHDDRAPVVLLIHGGGWVVGSLDTHDPLCRHLANSTCAVVIAVDYRLAPEFPYPAALNDCRDALRWLFAAGEDLGIDPKRVVVAGDSAGGQIAAVLANESEDGRFGGHLAGQVLLYPVTDLTMSTPSYERVTDGFPLTAETMRWFAAQYLASGANPGDAELSPLLHPVAPSGPAALVCTVENDPLADEGTRYATKLAEAGTEVEFLHLRGQHHGLFTSAGVIATGREVLERVGQFIRQRFDR